MIGFVIVSHSAKLADGVCELAEQAAQGKVRIAVAGGASDPKNPIGTDASKVLQAIESVYSDDGVVVLMDLGSAVLSAELALELLPEDKRSRVFLCAAPLVEGTVAAVSLAAAGAGVEEILREAQAALEAKVAQIGGTQLVGAQQPSAAPKPAAQPSDSELWHESVVTLTNPLGLHARPAARLVRMVRRSNVKITIENLSTAAGPFDAVSINGLLSLGARQGHRLRIRVQGNQERAGENVEASAEGGPDAPVALTELTNFLASGCGEITDDGDREMLPDSGTPTSPSPGVLSGIAASAGIAIGPMVKLRAAAARVTARIVEDPDAEWQRLQSALHAAHEETNALYDWTKAHVSTKEAGIFDAQLLLLEDPELLADAENGIRTVRWSAEFAWQSATDKLERRLRALDDPYLRARAADVADITSRVIQKLTGAVYATPLLREHSILVAHDLAPSEVKDLDPAMVLGACLESSSATAHSVILVRALGIPAVVGLGPAISAVAEGTTIAIDGQRGEVWVSPDPSAAKDIENRRATWLAARRTARTERLNPAATRDGRRIHVLANLKSVPETAEALEYGAEGVGLLRSEFLFLDRSDAPDEEEQFTAYRTIAETLGAHPLVVRTLDIGGDKRVPYVDIGEEENPMLGLRGIRLTLARRDLFRTQLRAILRAAYDHRVDIMFPMISSLQEVRDAKTEMRKVETELERDGIAFRKDMKVGVMIEVPAAVAVADQLAREVSFFSIGSNDLAQYVMAADRLNARVASLADPFQPAVLRMLRETIHAGRQAGIGVCLCGELAADTLATPLLLGMGLEEFSASPKLIPELKHAIAKWTVPEAEAIAREAMTLDSSECVRSLLSNTLR